MKRRNVLCLVLEAEAAAAAVPEAEDMAAVVVPVSVDSAAVVVPVVLEEVTDPQWAVDSDLQWEADTDLLWAVDTDRPCIPWGWVDGIIAAMNVGLWVAAALCA